MVFTTQCISCKCTVLHSFYNVVCLSIYHSYDLFVSPWKSSRGHSQGLPKIFRALIHTAHRAVLVLVDSNHIVQRPCCVGPSAFYPLGQLSECYTTILITRLLKIVWRVMSGSDKEYSLRFCIVPFLQSNDTV